MINYLSKLLYILSGKKISIIVLLALSILTAFLESVGVGLIGPFLKVASNPTSLHDDILFNWLYEKLNLSSNKQFILILGLITFFTFLIKSIVFLWTNKYLFTFIYNHKKELTCRLFSAYLNAPYSFYLMENTASSINNIALETTMLAEQCLLPLLSATVNAIIISFLFVLLASINLTLLSFIMGFVLLILIIFAQYGNKLKQWGKIKTQTNQDIVFTTNQALGGLKETQILGCEFYFEKKMLYYVNKWKKAVTQFQIFHILPNVVIQTSLIGIVIFYVCVANFLNGENVQDMTIVIGSFAAASLRLIPSLNQFMMALGRLKNSSYVLELIYRELKKLDKLNEKNSPINSTNYYRLKKTMSSRLTSQRNNLENLSFQKTIELKNITYKYPATSEDVIKSLSLSINKGQSIALIGKSGSGKTTLIDIITGLLMPLNGDILVDNKSIYVNLRSWQDLIGYIPQSIFLMDDTIERNIAFGVPDTLIDPEKLQKSINLAQLSEVIEQLPNGIKTKVGERGTRLSGGQRQRIGIARAIYHEREVLILDEATSALDNETETLVNESIKSLVGQKTLVIIAHRLSTIEYCDRIYVIDKGRIIKSGTYQEVILSESIV